MIELEPVRRRLPVTRESVTHHFDVATPAGHVDGYITIGLYDDGRPGEMFITLQKDGSTLAGLLDVIATAVSLGLQYGVPPAVYAEKFAFSRFEPAGPTANADVPVCTSLTDYIFRWFGVRFCPDLRAKWAQARDEAVTEAVEHLREHSA